MNEKKEESAVSIIINVLLSASLLGSVLSAINWALITVFSNEIWNYQDFKTEILNNFILAFIVAYPISFIGMIPQFILSTIVLKSFKNRNKNIENKFYINLGINLLFCLLTAFLTIVIFLVNWKDIIGKVKLFSTEIGIGFIISIPYIIAWEGLLYYHTKKYFDGIVSASKENTPLDYF